MLTLGIFLQIAWAITTSKLGAVFAASVIVLGASTGISKIGVAALEAITRQPETAGDVRSNLIVAAALIEGVSFFALVICLLVLFI